MVDGSNESLYSPNEELDLKSLTGTPLQKSFEKVQVNHSDSMLVFSTLNFDTIFLTSMQCSTCRKAYFFEKQFSTLVLKKVSGIQCQMEFDSN